MDSMDIESMQRWYLLWQLIWLLQAGMTIWMLVDAYRRGVEYFWFWIIFLFQPLGAWVYLFAVKLRADGGFNLGNWRPFEKRVSMDELRFRVEKSPTQANYAALAEALVDQGQYQEAIPHLETVLRREPEYCRALYRLALCHVELGRPAEALPHLQLILAKDERWSNYQAWHVRIRALELSGDPAAAVGACRELVRKSPTSHHHYLLAERLHAGGQGEEAERVLDQLLEEYQYASGPIRRMNRSWAKKAQQLQKQLAGK